MGIIVRQTTTTETTKESAIMFYLKGAEVIMEEKMRPDQRVSLTTACEELAHDGLRTLVISQRQLSEADYKDFANRYEEAKASLGDREGQIQQAIESIEEGMEYLASTGVEDRL